MLFMIFRKKQEKILPVQDIDIGAWAEQNFMVSILKNMETGWDWVMNHCIQLRGSHYMDYQWDANEINVTFYPYAMHNLQPGLIDLCPFINKYMIPKSLVSSNYGKFSDFIECAIDGNYYLSTYLDQYFRDNMEGRTGFHHPNYIYGYSKKNKEVYLMDNFEKGKFGKKIVSYEQINHAYSLVPGDLWVVSVFLYQLYPYRHQFVPAYVKEQIMDYLQPGKGICYFNRTVCVEDIHDDENYYNAVYFGIHCYTLLQNYLDGILEGNGQYRDGDWRSFSMLCDHKKMMLQRYEYMLENAYIHEDVCLYEKLNKLNEDCVVLLNIFLKYALTGKKDYLVQCANRLRDIKEKDTECMGQFAERIIVT